MEVYKKYQAHQINLSTDLGRYRLNEFIRKLPFHCAHKLLNNSGVWIIQIYRDGELQYLFEIKHNDWLVYSPYKEKVKPYSVELFNKHFVTQDNLLKTTLNNVRISILNQAKQLEKIINSNFIK